VKQIRVWGGGIVESDDFYDICDREGILIWQDFLFACGDYPASDDFIEQIKVEATQQVKRVGHHASYVFFSMFPPLYNIPPSPTRFIFSTTFSQNFKLEND